MIHRHKINYAIAIVVIALGIIAVTTSTSAIWRSKEKAEHFVKKEEFASWITECLRNDSNHNDGDGDVSCRASRTINHQNQDGVSVHLKILDREERKMPRFKISVPLGAFLPAGLTLSLFDQQPFSVPFQFCDKNGCFINLDLADDVVNALKNNDHMKVTYMKVNRNMIDAKIDLDGFSQSLEWLEKQEQRP